MIHAVQSVCVEVIIVVVVALFCVFVMNAHFESKLQSFEEFRHNFNL